MMRSHLRDVALVLHQVDVPGLQLGQPALQLLDPRVLEGRRRHHQEGPLLAEGVRHGDGLHRLPESHLELELERKREREKQVNRAQARRQIAYDGPSRCEARE